MAEIESYIAAIIGIGIPPLRKAQAMGYAITFFGTVGQIEFSSRLNPSGSLGGSASWPISLGRRHPDERHRGSGARIHYESRPVSQGKERVECETAVGNLALSVVELQSYSL